MHRRLRPLAAEQTTLSTVMIGYWSRFARTGDPNRSDLPQWPRWDTRHVQSLAPGRDGVGPTAFERDHHLPFWQSLTD